MKVIEIKVGMNYKVDHPEYIIGELYLFKHKTDDYYLHTIFNGYSRIDLGGLFYVRGATKEELKYSIKDFFSDDIHLVSFLEDHLLPLDVVNTHRKEREDQLKQVGYKFLTFERERVLDKLL